MSKIFTQSEIGCIHNPAAGDEIALGVGTLQRAGRTKRVAVVGGGPAGMRAALTLAERGHQVTLYERQPELGGQVRLWARAPSRRELIGIADWLVDQLMALPVTIELGVEVDAARLAGESFDAVVVATGAQALNHGWTMLHPQRWNGPPLPGASLPHVTDYITFLSRPDIKAGHAVVLDSLGGRQGAVVAEVLAGAGCQVSFVTQLAQPSPDLAGSRDWGKVHGLLRRMGVCFIPDCEATAIGSDHIELRDIYTNDGSRIDSVDQVVMVLGASARDDLYHELAKTKQDNGGALHLIGDAMSPRRVNDAIREGELAARKI